MAEDFRITVAVARVLREFLVDVAKPRYGYDLMQSTGFPSGKLYPILARLQHAGGWSEAPRRSTHLRKDGRRARRTC